MAKRRSESKTKFVDPEVERWRKRYPRFPGVQACVELLRQQNVRGTWVDIIAAELTAHAPETFPELLAACRQEPDARVRLILLSAVAEAGLPEAMPLLLEHLHGDDASLRTYAVLGLEKIGTKEARAALWQDGVV